MNEPFPGGHVEYSFEMHVDYATSLNCAARDVRVRRIELSKESPEDEFDRKWRLVIHFNEVRSIQEVNEFGSELKEYIFPLLSFYLKEKISNIRLTGHGLVPREGGGAQAHLIMPGLSVSGTILSGGRKLNATETNIIENDLFVNDYVGKFYLINLYSYIMSLPDPVVQFVLLYLILYEIFGNQNSIDNFIMHTHPSTAQTESPHNGRMETIYTKLRNELTHRVTMSPHETTASIIDNLYMFKNIIFIAINRSKEFT
jgi:hypothetical protein